jgi:hypothetical protein
MQNLRATRSLRIPLIAVVVVVLGGTALASAATSTFGLHHGATMNATLRASLGRMSTRAVGAPVSLTSADKRFLASFAQGGAELTSATPLVTRGARTAYQVANTAGSVCYAVGSAAPAATGNVLGQVGCVPSFPSASSPLVDFSVVDGGTSSSGPAHVYRTEGIAADGVASVGYRTGDGRIVGVTPVVSNVYESSSVPPDAVEQLVALDATGNVIWSEDVGQ